jgi:hypothetical protein
MILRLMNTRKNFIITKKAGKYTKHPDKITKEQEQWGTTPIIER